jgi:hypothetical protein
VLLLSAVAACCGMSSRGSAHPCCARAHSHDTEPATVFHRQQPQEKCTADENTLHWQLIAREEAVGAHELTMPARLGCTGPDGRGGGAAGRAAAGEAGSTGDTDNSRTGDGTDTADAAAMLGCCRCSLFRQTMHVVWRSVGASTAGQERQRAYHTTPHISQQNKHSSSERST